MKKETKIVVNSNSFSVGDIVYGDTKKVILSGFKDKIVSHKFDCPCIVSNYQQEDNSIVATFVGNSKPLYSELQKTALYELDVIYEDGSKDNFDITLTNIIEK